MTDIRVNPDLRDDDYLDCLNRSFRGGWDLRNFGWHFKRPFNGVPPDTLVLYDADRPAAGLAMNHRQLRTPDGAVATVAVITAAWTLREFLGRCYFQYLVEAAMERAQHKACLAVIGFVRAANSSTTTMRRCHALEYPGHYLSALATTRGRGRPLATHAAEIPYKLPEPGADQAASAGFHYPGFREWREQFLDRPNPTRCLRIGDCFAIVEETESTDRLVYLSGSVAQQQLGLDAVIARAAQRNQRFFWYSIADWARDFALEREIDVKAGMLMLIPLGVGGNALIGALGSEPTWHIQCGDRM